MWTADKVVNMKAIFPVTNTNLAVVKITPEKNSGLYKIWTHDLSDTSALPTEQPAPSWLVSSVGRALHWYPRGHRFEFHTGLNFFHCCSSRVHYCEDHFHIYITSQSCLYSSSCLASWGHHSKSSLTASQLITFQQRLYSQLTLSNPNYGANSNNF